MSGMCVATRAIFSQFHAIGMLPFIFS